MTKYDNIIPMKKYNGAGLTQEQIDKDKIEIEFRVKELVKEYLEKKDNKEFWLTRRAYETVEREQIAKSLQELKENCASKTKDCLGIQKIQGSITTQLIFQWIVISFMISIIFLIMRNVGILKIF